MTDPMPAVRGILGMPEPAPDYADKIAARFRALTEQTRISNLIAYYAALEERQRNGYSITLESRQFMNSFETAIREGLGIQ